MTPASVRDLLAASIARICRLDLSEVDDDRPLPEYGLTSREAVQLAGELADALGTELPSTLIWQHSSISALVAALANQPAEAPDTAPALTGEPIAVVGIGCRLPGGVHGPADLWDLLLGEQNTSTLVPDGRWEQFGHDSPEQLERLARTTRWGGFLDDIAGFDAGFFGIAPREAAMMDPQQRLLLEVAHEALEHAGIAPDRLRGSRTGVFAGISGNEYSRLTLGDVSRANPWTATGAALSVAANRLSYAFDLRGPSIAVDTACSSSLVAVHLAMQSLRCGESEVALAAGANLVLGPEVTAGFDQLGVCAPDGRCKPFDAAADGIGRAEGVAVVVLKPLSAAVRDQGRVLALLRGSAVNSDGRSAGLTAPNPEAQQALLRAACASSEVDPAEVDYVEAHGTGTELGDPIEAGALGAVLGQAAGRRQPLLLGSVKSNLGHLEAAAGITGLIKVVLALTHRRIPASLHFREPSPHIPFERLRLEVAAEARPWPEHGRPALAGVSGFGFGGTNAHVVVEQAPRPADRDALNEGQFLLAAPTRARVRRAADRLADWLDGPGESARLADVGHTLARRASGRVRAVVTATDRRTLVSGLRSLASDTTVPGVAVGRPGNGAVWVFSGQGAQWPGMGQQLLAEEPAFADAVAELADAGLPLREVIANGIVPEAFAELQPMLFGLQVALARLWQHHGARPAAVIGHSLGEVAAAVVAGAVSLEDGVRIVTTRSRLLATTAGQGAMAMLELSADDVAGLLTRYPGVEAAVFNAPQQTVVAGPVEQVHAVVAEAEARGVATGLIKSTVAGHCRLVEPITAALRDELSEVKALDPVVPIYPTALDDACFDAAYWVANVRRPVRFAEAVEAAHGDGYTTFLEISAHPLLRHAISQIAPDAAVLGTLRRAEPGSFHAAVGALLAHGDQPPRTAGRLIDLPTTEWEHGEHWAPPLSPAAPAGEHPLLGAHGELPDQDTHLWRADLGTGRHPWLADHRIDGQPILAAACFVEMAFTAAATALDRPAEKIGLRSVALHRPLPLTEHTWVTTTCTRTEVRFHTKDPDGRWILHCSVSLTEADGATGWRPDAYCPEPVTDLYDRLRSLGIDYGPAFTGATEAHRGEGSALLTVEVPEDAPRAGYLLHPALLDACLQGLVAAAPEAGPEVRYLPMEFGAVRLFGDPGAGVRAHVSVTSGEGGATGELRLVDGDDQVLLELTGVFLREVSRAPAVAPLALLARDWLPLDPPAAGKPGPVVLVAQPGHPDANAAVAAFEAAGSPCRLVSVGETEMADRPSVVALLISGNSEPETGRRAVLDCVAWVRALAALPGKPPRLWLVTSGAAAVLPGEPGRPGPASLRGLVRVLSYEHPGLRASWLDVDSVADLVAEVTAGAADDEVAWRAGQRYVARLVPASRPEPAVPVVRPDGGYVITGGCGGLGLLLAGWLADRGAARLVLNGRKPPGPAAAAVIDELRSTGTAVEVVLGDVATPGVAERLLEAAGTVRGVAHVAGVFDDLPVSRLDDETVWRTWRPKADGAWQLHTASLEHELDWWLGFSSSVAVHGLPGQPAYASANAYLDAVVEFRQALGLPAASVNWGTWAEVGAAVGLEVPWIHPIGPAEGLELIEAVIAAGAARVGAVRLNTSRLAADFPELADIPFFGELLAQGRVDSVEWPGVEALRSVEPGEARRLVCAQVRFRVASVMGLASEALADDLPLTSLGVDSLLATRIRNALQHDLELSLPMSALLNGASLAEVCARVCVESGFEESVRVAEPVVLVPPRDAAERLVASVWQEVLGEPVGVTHSFAGDERQASEVAELLAVRSGHAFDPVELFARPTVELMANLVRAADRVSGPVRVLREGRDPLFCFHPGGGDTAVFRQLVELLEVPAYGFDRVADTSSVEERAERFLPELRAIQPDGSYRLTGWSFGGFLAFEVAQQLLASGAEVELLALIDPILPLPDPPGMTEVERLELRFRRFGEFLETSYGRRVSLPYRELAGLGAPEQAELLIATIVRAGLVNEHVSAAILAHQRASFLDARLLEDYQPKPYPGRVLFYSAGSPVPGGLRDPRFDRADPARGWDSVCHDLEIVTVPGHHLSLLDPPNVHLIAQHLDGALRRVAR